MDNIYNNIIQVRERLNRIMQTYNIYNIIPIVRMLSSIIRANDIYTIIYIANIIYSTFQVYRGGISQIFNGARRIITGMNGAYDCYNRMREALEDFRALYTGREEMTIGRVFNVMEKSCNIIRQAYDSISEILTGIIEVHDGITQLFNNAGGMLM